LWRALVVGLVLGAAAARAGPLADADALAADPDVPAFALSIRDYTGATVGARVPLAGEEADRWSLRLPMLVELHNGVGNLAPNNFWRGMIGVEVNLRATGEWAPRWTLAFFHESDHATWGTGVAGRADYGFLELNSLSAAVAWPEEWGGQRWTLSADVRLHLVSCTVGAVECSSGVLGWGSFGLETRGGLVWLGGAEHPAGRWMPTAALFLDWLPPHDLIRTERRLVVHAGAYLRTERRGLFTIFVMGWVGNDVGLNRRDRIAQMGVAFRWAPF
jgi:hypothetical protein